jgi:hypothetical protein
MLLVQFSNFSKTYDCCVLNHWFNLLRPAIKTREYRQFLAGLPNAPLGIRAN